MTHTTRFTTFATPVMVGLLLAACAGENRDANDPSRMSDSDRASATPATMGISRQPTPGVASPTSDATGSSGTTSQSGPGTAGAAGSSGAALPGTVAGTTDIPASRPRETLTDDQILAVVQAANNSEIEEARLATSKAKNAEVRSFAQMMIQHHTDAKQKGGRVAQQAKLTLKESGMTAEMKSDAQKNMETLRAKTGADFDRAYIEHQVEEHQRVLTAIDQRLMADAKSPEVRALLQEVRPVIAQHLEQAQRLQSSVVSK